MALDFDPPKIFHTAHFVPYEVLWKQLHCGTERTHNLADTQRAWRSNKYVKLVGWIVSYQFLYLCNELFVS